MRLAVDNSTAVACINNMGSVRSATIPLIRFIAQKYLGILQVEGYFDFCSVFCVQLKVHSCETCG